MKRKISAVLIAAAFMLQMCVSASFYDVDSESRVGNAVSQLAKLGILQGFGDGSFHPDDTLTRAQFAKISVCMLGEEKSAVSRKENNVFSDVKSSDWSSGYINYIAERGIINGYPNGSFGADETINYAQVLTILVRLLGYNGEDVSFRWPDGYISKAEAIGITDGISFDKYENVTRANAAYLVYNTLLADKKDGGAVKLLSDSSIEDIVIYGDSYTDASVAAGNIITTKGLYKLAASSSINSDDFGMKGTMYVDADGKAVAFVPDKGSRRKITITSAAKNTDSGKIEITFTENGSVKTESFSSSATAYYNAKSENISNAVSEMENGREAYLIYSEDGLFTSIMLAESTLEGPVTVTSGAAAVYSAFGISSAPTVIRDGKRANSDDIKTYDVAYYMRSINTLYAYSDKISGTYEEAYPIKANVTRVKIAGNEYELATQAAVNKMNESEGAFSLGDRVTLLLGRNGNVVDVVDLNASGALDVVVLIECYSEISEEYDKKGQRIQYATVMLADGTEVTYETDDDYSDYNGEVMKVIYSGGIAKLNYVRPSSISGVFDLSARTLGGRQIASDCNILELLDKPENGRATVKKIELRDILLNKLSDEQVIHAQTSGAMKDITFLYVKNVTKSDAEYGVIKSSGGSGKSGNTYTVLSGTKEKKIDTLLKLSVGDMVEIIEENSSVKVAQLQKITTGNEVEAYSAGRIRIEGVNYTVSDYVIIYGGSLGENYHSMSVNEMLDSKDIVSVTLYSDTALKSGGIIRAIFVRTKSNL